MNYHVIKIPGHMLRVQYILDSKYLETFIITSSDQSSYKSFVTRIYMTPNFKRVFLFLLSNNAIKLHNYDWFGLNILTSVISFSGILLLTRDIKIDQRKYFPWSQVTYKCKRMLCMDALYNVVFCCTRFSWVLESFITS